MAADDTNWMYGYDERVGAIELAASIGTIAALINVRTVNRLGMDYSSKQELQADRIARDYLAFKGMNPNALSSAINKIKEFSLTLDFLSLTYHICKILPLHIDNVITVG